jgi:hypothetical protein
MKSLKIVLVSLITMIGISCNMMQDSVKGSGTVSTKEYSLTAFESIYNTGVFDVELIQGSEEKLVVEMDDNLHEYFEYSIIENQVKIGMKEGISISKNKKMLVKVYFKNLKLIENKAVGDMIENTNATFKSLKIINKAVGDLTMNGTAESIDITNSAVGDLDLEGLKTISIKMENKAVGNTKIFAFSTVDIINKAVGDLTIYGNPATKKVIDDSVGELRYQD